MSSYKLQICLALFYAVVTLTNPNSITKLSLLERGSNFAVLVIFFAQITLVTIAVIFIYILGYNQFDKYLYIYPGSSGVASLLPLWLTSW